MNGQEELRASELLLDLGVSVPYRPLGFLFKKKRHSITMRTPGAGGMMRIANKYLALGAKYDDLKEYDFEQQMKFVAEHGRAISEIVACTIVRGDFWGRVLNKPVAWWLRWRVHPAYLGEAMVQMLTLLDITPFFATIKLAQAVNLMTRRLSH